METPKKLGNAVLTTVNLGGKETACEGAAKRAWELGVTPIILSIDLEGEAREVGTVLAGISEQICNFDKPFKAPCALISGGETTVKLAKSNGKGGPNQEFILGFARKIDGSPRIAVGSIGTDGSDGPTRIAGGVADGFSLKRAKKMGISLLNNLKRHDSASVLEILKDVVKTGATGTNVMDLRVIYIEQAKKDK